MKKIVSLLLVLAIALTLCACGEDHSQKKVIEYFVEQPIPKPQGIAFDSFDDYGTTVIYWYIFEEDTTSKEAYDFWDSYVSQIKNEGIDIKDADLVGSLKDATLYMDGRNIGTLVLGKGDTYLLGIGLVVE